MRFFALKRITVNRTPDFEPRLNRHKPASSPLTRESNQVIYLFNVNNTGSACAISRARGS